MSPKSLTRPEAQKPPLHLTAGEAPGGSDTSSHGFKGAILGYDAGTLVGISLEGELGLGHIAREWQERGHTVVVTTEKDALETWHTTYATGNPRWDLRAA